MSHLVETMAYVGKVPWHGLGKYVGDNVIPAGEMIKFAEMDWSVDLVPVYIQAEAGDSPTYSKVSDSYAVKRDKDSRILGVVGNRYTPVQNRELFQFMDLLVGEGGLSYETAGSLQHGKKVWALAKLNDQIKVTDDDVIQPYLLGTNSHDGSEPMRVLYTTVQVVCNNTLRAALSSKGRAGIDYMAIRHTGDPMKKVGKAREILKIVDETSRILEEELQRLRQEAFDIDRMLRFSNKLLGVTEGTDPKDVPTRTQNIRDALVTLYENGPNYELAGDTKWNALASVTNYVTHHRTTRGGSKRRKDRVMGEREARLDSSWFGSGKHMIDRARTLLAEAST